MAPRLTASGLVEKYRRARWRGARQWTRVAVSWNSFALSAAEKSAARRLNELHTTA